jgi:hypothetical protein
VISTLTFVPLPADDNTKLKCEGSNPRLQNSALEDTLIMNVLCKFPSYSLRPTPTDHVPPCHLSWDLSSLFYVCDTLEMNKMYLSCATCEKFLFPVCTWWASFGHYYSNVVLRWSRKKYVAKKVRVDKGVNLGQLYWWWKICLRADLRWSELWREGWLS